jgi:branched-chain amino acid transport system substrate-binding protein
MLRRHGRRVWCVGSNYIWAWENNKILREAVTASGGQVLAERYFPVGETDFGAVIEQILECRPDFVFNTLIGDSAYAFYRGFRAAAARRGIDQPTALPIASCSLAEPELREIGAGSCDGHVSSSVYFESVPTARNAAFREAWRRHAPESGPCCADAEAAYFTIHLLARAIERAGTGEVPAVLGVLPEVRFEAPQGQVRIDAENRHAWLTPRIGVSNSSGGFDIIYAAPAPVRPDPYLVWTEPPRSSAREDGDVPPVLRLVR